MQTRSLTKKDFDHIVEVIDSWWGGATSALAHPIFFYELGGFARVVEDNGMMIGFVFALITPDTPPCGYIHMVGVHPQHRRRNVGKFIYAWFEEECKKRECTHIKATTTPGNEGSLLFHNAIGWDAQTMQDYAGPGRTRIVFTKQL